MSSAAAAAVAVAGLPGLPLLQPDSARLRPAGTSGQLDRAPGAWQARRARPGAFRGKPGSGSEDEGEIMEEGECAPSPPRRQQSDSPRVTNIAAPPKDVGMLGLGGGGGAVGPAGLFPQQQSVNMSMSSRLPPHLVGMGVAAQGQRGPNWLPQPLGMAFAPPLPHAVSALRSLRT